MQKISEYIREHQWIQESEEQEMKASLFNRLYEAKLREMGAKSPLDLTEEESQIFFEYLKTLKESEIKDEKGFKEYAYSVLKKAHKSNFDEKIADKVIKDLSSKVKNGDWGSAVGRLTSGLGK